MKSRESQRLVRQLMHHLSQPGRRKWLFLVLLLVAGYLVARPVLERSLGISLPDILNTSNVEPLTISSPGEQAVLTAFEQRKSDVMVEVSAKVKHLLPDDNIGSRHQKMILTLPSGHTVLLAHNIDLAPRVPVDRGDAVTVRGEYEYTEKGGVIHWTHHDPAGRRDGGWVRHDGTTYE